jgi:hypothetical protein
VQNPPAVAHSANQLRTAQTFRKQRFAISLATTSQSGFRKTGKPRNCVRRDYAKAICQRDYARAIMKDHHKPEKLRMECVGKAVAPLPNPPPAGKISSEFPRLARDFGCGLSPSATLRVTPANRLNLELAKGFEPPTP